MGISNVMSLTLGEWIITARGWSKAHQQDGDNILPPSEMEFEKAVLAVRGAE